MADFVVDVIINTTGADGRLKELQTNLDGVKQKAQQASTDGIERMTKNGGAMGLLNDLTGGLAMKFKDAYESIKLSNAGLKGMRAALLATGIGALVVAIGAIAANWEEIMKFANATSKEVDQQISRANELREVTKLQYEILVQSDNILKSQGKTEEQIVQLKKDALAEDITSLKLQIEANKLKKQELLDAQLEVEYAKSSANIFAQIKGLFLDNSEALEEQVKLVADQEKEFLTLTNTLAGIELQQKAAEKARFDAAYKTTKVVTEEVWKREHEETASAQRITDMQLEKFVDRNKAEADAYIAGREPIKAAMLSQDEFDAQLAEAKKEREAQDFEDWKNNQQAKLQLASSGLGALSQLAEVFAQGNSKRARAAFNVSKGLALAEATANTYSAVVAVLKDPTFIGPSRFIAAGTALTMGLTNIAKIAMTKFNASGSGSGGGGMSGGGNIGAIGSGPAAAPPQAALDFSFLQNQQPVQTYVIGEDVKNSNEANQKIQDQSKL